jgi:hypothetical protein
LHQLGNPELNLFCETGTEMDCGIDSIDLYVNSREEILLHPRKERQTLW